MRDKLEARQVNIVMLEVGAMVSAANPAPLSTIRS
jgi:hypothetical protein